MTKLHSIWSKYVCNEKERQTSNTLYGKLRYGKSGKQLLPYLLNLFDLMQLLNKKNMIVTNITTKNLFIVCGKTKKTLKIAKRSFAYVTNRLWSISSPHTNHHSTYTTEHGCVSPPERIVMKMITCGDYIKSDMRKIKRAVSKMLDNYIVSYNTCIPSTVSPLSYEYVKNMEVDTYARMIKSGMTDNTKSNLCETYNVFVIGMILFDILKMSNIIHENIDLYDDLTTLATGMTRIHSKQRPVICASKNIYKKILQLHHIM